MKYNFFQIFLHCSKLASEFTSSKTKIKVASVFSDTMTDHEKLDEADESDAVVQQVSQNVHQKVSSIQHSHSKINYIVHAKQSFSKLKQIEI